MTPGAAGAERGQTRDRTRNGEADRPQRDEGAASGDAIDESASWLSVTLAVGFATLGALTMPSTGFLLTGILGALLVGVGTQRGSELVVGIGAGLLICGGAVAGALGASPAPLVLRTLLALLAWDAGRYGVAIGEQLGRSADTRRIELVHSAAAAAVGVAGAALGYASYSLLAGEGSLAAELLLFFGAVVLVLGLRDAASPPR